MKWYKIDYGTRIGKRCEELLRLQGSKVSGAVRKLSAARGGQSPIFFVGGGEVERARGLCTT